MNSYKKMIDHNRALLKNVETNGDTIQFWLENSACLQLPLAVEALEELLLTLFSLDRKKMRLFQVNKTQFGVVNMEQIRDTCFFFDTQTKQYSVTESFFHVENWHLRVKWEKEKKEKIMEEIEKLKNKNNQSVFFIKWFTKKSSALVKIQQLEAELEKINRVHKLQTKRLEQAIQVGKWTKTLCTIFEQAGYSVEPSLERPTNLDFEEL